jgi:hypothetical protein
MHNVAVALEGIEFPNAGAFTSTRDVVRAIVRKIADAFAKEKITVALEASADRDDPRDLLIVFAEGQTASMPLRYSAQLVSIGSVPHFIGHNDGVQLIADRIVAAVEAVVRRWAY